MIGIFLSENFLLNDPFIYREKGHSFKFINPLIGFEVGSEEDFGELKDLNDVLEKYIEQQYSQEKAESISVYFRNLNTGKLMGVNEDEKYAPASMFKVFIMTAYLKLAETKPEILKEKIYYMEGIDHNQFSYYKPSKSLEAGKEYSVEELMRRMIIQSGNNSFNLLVKYLGDEVFVDLLKDFGLPYPKADNDIDFMSAKSYSLLFRIFYNATYLSSQMSEKALILLSETEFKKGLIAGLPGKLTVAHKFGERSFLKDPENADSQINELHDCGIIYYPQNPYFLCVMTKGLDFSDLEKVIMDISATVYEDVEEDMRK